MANALYTRFSAFKDILLDAATMASPHVDFDVLSLVVGTEQPTEEMNRSEVAQVCVRSHLRRNLSIFSDIFADFRLPARHVPVLAQTGHKTRRCDR
jgi:hypothetical protein